MDDFSAMNSSITGMFLGTTDLSVNVYNQAQVSSDCQVTDSARKSSSKLLFYASDLSKKKLFCRKPKKLIEEHQKII